MLHLKAYSISQLQAVKVRDALYDFVCTMTIKITHILIPWAYKVENNTIGLRMKQ